MTYSQMHARLFTRNPWSEPPIDSPAFKQSGAKSHRPCAAIRCGALARSRVAGDRCFLFFGPAGADLSVGVWVSEL
jgi:hypothetical protein